jgi:enoyl-CoA hydratase/carnithine racemase
VKNNLVPGGGASVRMPHKLGTGATAWLALSGELVPAELLQATGWLHSVVEPPDLLPTANALADTLAARPVGAQRRYKALITLDPQATAAALERELEMFDEHWSRDDVAGQLTRFLSGERPDATPQGRTSQVTGEQHPHRSSPNHTSDSKEHSRG